MNAQKIINKAKASSKVAVNIHCPPKRKKVVRRKKRRVVRKRVVKRLRPVLKIPAINLPPIHVTGSESSSTSTANAINTLSTIDQRIEERLKQISKQKPKKLIKEEICEHFTLRCNSGAKVLWQAIGVSPIVTIKVENRSACNMVLTVHRVGAEGEVEANSQVILPDGVAIITADHLRSLEVECQGVGNEECCGFFSLFVHVPID